MIRVMFFLLMTTGIGHADTQFINLLQFQSDDLESLQRLNRTSDSRPLTFEELQKLTKAGIGEVAIIEMMRTRKVMIVADADTLLALKKSGASDAMIAAVSAYALPPNDHLELAIQVDIETPGTVSKAPYLYLEVWHSALNRQEAMLHADLRTLMANGRAEVLRDRTDPLLPRVVRTVKFNAKVLTRHAGLLELRVAISQKPGLKTLRTPDFDSKKKVETLKINYPGVSLERRCRLDLNLHRDELLRDAYALKDTRLDCRWD